MPILSRQPAFTVRRSDFPKDFVFGSSTSAYQIEGSSFGGCGSSHWDSFAASKGNVANFENGSIACDHYTRWEGDLDLMKDLGLDAYRFSSSWARILPQANGETNKEGLDFYDRLVDGLLERGIAPHLTLYHWELPSYLADIGGWRNRDVGDYFADYAEIMIKCLGDRLASVATFNEPWCVTWLSHYHGMHAPGLRDIRAASRTAHLVPVAHGKAMAAMRALGQEELGVVLNFEHTSPYDDKPSSAKAAELEEGILNRWFLSAFTKGKYPDTVLDHIEAYLPNNWQDDMAQIATPIDWMGVNYYTRTLVSAGESHLGSALPLSITHHGGLPRTEMDWEVFPEGLGEILCWIRDNYTHDTPLAITENGMANKDMLVGDAVDDQERIAYLDAHFNSALKAIDKGVPLKAYFVWSLMDNFEWSFGFDKRFGIIHVDFDSLQRTPKASYHALQHMLSHEKPH
ncbi:GH1 family beta-glucosidase [Cohaesibacter celericrescens]|uniref:Beta-glucosidase n=1 Tax=Cohaesibacter celericrescens TaxID=2067669 RepID=A0A2N5XR03_9HYPH|nr:GH1 family beta-glucosidase [Cohaesibacter celericrescens]PLW76929.1 beta-glucosidase [Cohaesibacter celericrescens]